MQVVYEPENLIEAHLVKGLLGQAGIEAWVRGEHLVGAMGELPMIGLLAVMVPDEDAARAVEALGEDARDGGLADAAGAGEQEGVMHPAALQRIAQRAHHVFLPDQLGKAPGSPFAGKNQIGHEQSLGQ